MIQNWSIKTKKIISAVIFGILFSKADYDGSKENFGEQKTRGQQKLDKLKVQNVILGRCPWISKVIKILMYHTVYSHWAVFSYVQLIASTKETLPNCVVGCSVCLWVSCACFKHKKSRKEVVSVLVPNLRHLEMSQ